MTRGVAALAALALGLALVGCYLLLVCTPWGQAADVQAFRVVFGLVPGGWAATGVALFARAAVVFGLASGAVVLGAAAIGRRAWGRLLAAVATVGVSVLVSLWLREDIFVRPRFTEEAFPQNSMPSNHAVVAAALVVAVVLLWPTPRPWWVVNSAGVVLLLVAIGNIESQAHRPSDVAASFLLVGAVATAALAVVGPTSSRR